jgi:hypothetical protein
MPEQLPVWGVDAERPLSRDVRLGSICDPTSYSSDVRFEGVIGLHSMAALRRRSATSEHLLLHLAQQQRPVRDLTCPPPCRGPAIRLVRRDLPDDPEDLSARVDGSELVRHARGVRR